MNEIPKKAGFLAAGMMYLTVMLAIMSIPDSVQAQQLSATQIYQEGMQAKERGEFEKAFHTWEKAGEQTGYAIGREYLKLAAELAHKEKYETATRMYYRVVSEALSHTADRRAFSEDLLHLELLMKPDEFEKKFELVKSNDAELQKAVRLFWENADPLPAEPVNPRLVEHYGRISEALSKFPDESSPLGFDDRGKVWVRFGEPDKRRHINATDIWVYEDVNLKIKGKLILYFLRNDEGLYKQIDSLDDSIPGSKMNITRERAIMGRFSEGFLIQLSLYRQLSGFDPYFASVSVRLQEYFDNAFSKHVLQTVSLATHIRSNLRHESNKFRAAAPPESSAEKEKIPAIPLEVFQYRLLNTDDEPVLATFVESRPAAAFLADLTSGQEQMLPDGETDITGEISRWYSLTQGVDLRDASGGLAGRLRSAPQLNLDEKDRTPSVSLFNIPYLSEEFIQQFYVMLENRHPQSKPREESVFPDEIRGLGRAAIPQSEHLDLSGETPVLGDLILGYGRMKSTDQPLRFPFVASHDRSIPEGENLVVHFEVYRLQTGPKGFASFEADYEIQPKQGLFGRLLKNRDKLSGTLTFEPRDSRFTESLEFEELNLEPGSYELRWMVRDLVSGESQNQTIEFEVIDQDEIFSDKSGS